VHPLQSYAILASAAAFALLSHLAPASEPTQATEPEKDRPNFVFIIADDLGIGDVSAYGSTMIPTPHLDRLAAQGVRATDAQVTASVCTPSRYSILTGRNYWRLKREWQGDLIVDDEVSTMAKTFTAAGYATGYFGKWHLGWDGLIRIVHASIVLIGIGTPRASRRAFSRPDIKPISARHFPPTSHRWSL
jgi:hypothetical protein